MYGPERVALAFDHCGEARRAQDKIVTTAGSPEETYEIAVTRMEKDILDIKAQGKIPWIKEHNICSIKRDIVIAVAKSTLNEEVFIPNPTTFPDELFSTFTPIIIIRHPAIIARSFYVAQLPVFCLEADDDYMKVMSSPKYAKMWFDAKSKSDGDDDTRPIVIDAEDIVYNTEHTMALLCERLGIDPEGVQYKWDPLPLEQRPNDDIMRGFFNDMWNSSGVVRKEKLSTDIIGVDEETEKWKREFGEEVARTLRKRVDEDLPIYEYLRQFRLVA